MGLGNFNWQQRVWDAQDKMTPTKYIQNDKSKLCTTLLVMGATSEDRASCSGIAEEATVIACMNMGYVASTSDRTKIYLSDNGIAFANAELKLTIITTKSIIQELDELYYTTV